MNQGPATEEPAAAGSVAAPAQRGAELAAALVELLGPDAAGVSGSVDGNGTACVDVPRERWVEAVTAARDRLGLDFMDWLSAVDEPDATPPGVDVVLHVATSTEAGRRMLLRTRVPADDLRLPSLTAVYGGTAWHERETFEMFGVDFTGFEDGTDRGLRSLLLPEGFEGTPLRKSFVLAARALKPWPGAKEPGESHSDARPGRKKPLAVGQADLDTWLHGVGGPDAADAADAEPGAGADGAEPEGTDA